MNSKHLLALAAFSLVAVGAGCAKGSDKDVRGNEAAGEVALNPVVETVASAPATVAGIDDTWQTYASRDGGWQFQWPTKGAMAPRWEADFSADVKDGCYGEGERRRVKLGDAEFCHTGKRDGNKSTDYYVTARGGQHVRLTFTKQGSDTFDWAGYSAYLDQVVATFKSLK